MENKPVIIIGVSGLYHNSSATLVIDGEIIAAVEEERFSRIKGDASLPKLSIEFLMGKYNLTAKDITAVAFYENPNIKLERLLTTLSLGKLRSYNLFKNSLRNWFPKKYFVQSGLKKIIGRNVPIYYLHHHTSHAASAFYPSNFDQSAYLTIDGVGEWESLTWGICHDAEITKKNSIDFPNSLGMFYSAFTYYLGFKVNSGEYKVMGLAPYGIPRYKEDIYENLISVNKDNSISLNPQFFKYFTENKTIDKNFEKLFNLPIRRPKDKLTQKHADIAASVQAVLNEVILKVAAHIKKECKQDNLVIAGGVALNVTAMGLLERSGLFKKIYIQPASGDAGGSLGAALYLSYNLFKVPRRINGEDMMQNCYLGAESEDFYYDTERTLELYGVNSHHLSDEELINYATKALLKDEVLAIYRGKSEFGPRALGNRSIIASAKNPRMVEKLNSKVKLRENFRPFAPISLEEDFQNYFKVENGITSPYMLKSYLLKEEYRVKKSFFENNQASHFLAAKNDKDEKEKTFFDSLGSTYRSPFSAVTHVDYSSRVQTVTKASNQFLYHLLISYKKFSSIGVLVNTSFNLKNEPMVNSPIDAIECFIKSDIDYLILDNYLISKKDNQTLKSKISREHHDD